MSLCLDRPFIFYAMPCIGGKRAVTWMVQFVQNVVEKRMKFATCDALDILQMDALAVRRAQGSQAHKNVNVFM